MFIRPICAVALAAAFSLPAHATTVATLTINNFNTSLKDLRPGDGIGPALTWGSQQASMTSGFEQVQNGWHQQANNQWVPSWPVDSSVDGFLNGAGVLDTVSAHYSTTQHLASNSAGLESLTVTAQATPGHMTSGQASLYRDFTLSAGTQVTFSVTINGSWSAPDYQGNWNPPLNWSSRPYANSAIQADIRVSDLNATWAGEGSTHWPPFSAGGIDSSIEDQVLKLTVKNTTGADAHYWMFIEGYASGWETAAPVPEPGSYAMLGAGLLVLGAIGRRRRA